MIPKEIYEKYHLADIDEYETESVFYETFLIQTDFVPNKILEGAATSEEYADELYYREVARREISGDTGNSTTQKPLDARVDGIERPTNIMLGTESNMEQASEQLRKALQMFAQTLTDEQAIEISTVYPVYEVAEHTRQMRCLHTALTMWETRSFTGWYRLIHRRKIGSLTALLHFIRQSG